MVTQCLTGSPAGVVRSGQAGAWKFWHGCREPFGVLSLPPLSLNKGSYVIIGETNTVVQTRAMVWVALAGGIDPMLCTWWKYIPKHWAETICLNIIFIIFLKSFVYFRRKFLTFSPFCFFHVPSCSARGPGLSISLWLQQELAENKTSVYVVEPCVYSWHQTQCLAQRRW